MEDVTVDKPARSLSGSKVEKWEPYGLLPMLSTAKEHLENPIELLSLHRVLLFEIMTPLAHVM